MKWTEEVKSIGKTTRLKRYKLVQKSFGGRNAVQKKEVRGADE
jgi:hypothetical protein